MMNRRAESNKAVHGNASDAVKSTNQKILEALRIKSPTVEKVEREEKESEAEEMESKTAVSPDQHEPKQEVRKEEEVEDLEEWLDEFLQ